MTGSGSDPGLARGPIGETPASNSPTTPDRLDRPAPGTLADRLFPPLGSGGDWSLDRVRDALGAVGDPHLAVPAVHVAGTNGKGTVATLLAGVFGADGRRAGLYTSPHLESVAERFRIGGRHVDERALLEGAARIAPVVERAGLTFFEAATVLAFDLFRRAEVEISVLEVGLGGRLDATNVVTPLVGAVTNVSMDHAEYLGDTLDEIAAEKAGIAKPGVPLVTGETDPSILRTLRAVAEDRGATFHVLGEDVRVEIAGRSPKGLVLRARTERWGELELGTSLLGRHQARNVALALGVLSRLPPEWLPSAQAVVRGIEGTRVPGRMEVRTTPAATVILDVAHNPAAARALAQALIDLDPPTPRSLLFGCLADKDWEGMLASLGAWPEHVVLAPVEDTGPRGSWDPEAALAPHGTGGWIVAPDPEAGLAAALDRSEGGTVLVTGSHRLVGAIRAALP